MDWKVLTRSNSSVIPVVQLFLSGMMLGALISGAYSPQEWMIPVLVYFCTGCLGITMTFHRFLTHRSFDLDRHWEYLFSLFGALGGTGSPLGWKMFHVLHHKYADTPRDPHSPQHAGWSVLFGSYAADFDKWAVRDLITDPFHRFLHDYYFPILIVWGTILACISIDALFLGFLFPMTIQIWVSNLSNYFNHKVGYRNFRTKDNSRNSWWLAILAWGEGWHNLHHMFPWCAKFGIRKHEIDITYWMIRLFGRNPHLLSAYHEGKLI